MSKSIVDAPPGKLLRFGLRLPIWLYRAHLGWLLGDRFLLLTHIGRKSGVPHETVVEVVQYDKDTDTYYVVSGWGKYSDWYQNIRNHPSVTIHVGGRMFPSEAMFIPVDKAVPILETYQRDHPIAFKELSGLFLGAGAQDASRAPQFIAEKMPMVAFRPEK